MPARAEAPYAVIGGTGFSTIARDFETVETDYGDVRVGKMQLGNREVHFLARHAGLEVPHLVNYRANIQALKKIGVDTILAVSACGRLAEDVWPGHLISVSDVDWDDAVGGREHTFADTPGLLLHASMDMPFSRELNHILADSWQAVEPKVKAIYRDSPDLHAGFHTNGTYFNIQGPQFTTPAREARIRRDTENGKVIGMTLVPEVHLAREMGIAYAAVGMCVDHSNYPGAPPVTHADGVMHAVNYTAQAAVALLDDAVARIPDDFYDPAAHDAFRHSLSPGQVIFDILRTNNRPNLAVILETALATPQQ